MRMTAVMARNERDRKKGVLRHRLTFIMDIKLIPRDDFEDLTNSISNGDDGSLTCAYLFKCAKPTRQTDESTDTFRHFNFPFMHRIDDDLTGTCQRTTYLWTWSGKYTHGVHLMTR